MARRPFSSRATWSTRPSSLAGKRLASTIVRRSPGTASRRARSSGSSDRSGSSRSSTSGSVSMAAASDTRWAMGSPPREIGLSTSGPAGSARSRHRSFAVARPCRSRPGALPGPAPRAARARDRSPARPPRSRCAVASPHRPRRHVARRPGRRSRRTGGPVRPGSAAAPRRRHPAPTRAAGARPPARAGSRRPAPSGHPPSGVGRSSPPPPGAAMRTDRDAQRASGVELVMQRAAVWHRP